MSWHVYLVACADGSLYCGATNDLARRLAAHDVGKGARYTRGRGPTRSSALRREIAVKLLPRAAKLRLASA